MQIEQLAQYDRFMDAIRLQLIVWREQQGGSFDTLCEKLDMSERTVRRRFRHPETLTLEEFFAWCELYGKDPAEILADAFRAAKTETNE